MKQPLTSQAHTHRPRPWPRSTRGRGQIIETKAKTEAKQPKAEASRIWPRDRGQASSRVCLSVMLCIVAKRYILQQRCQQQPGFLFYQANCNCQKSIKPACALVARINSTLNSRLDISFRQCMGVLQCGPGGSWSTKNFGWTCHSAFGHTNNWFVNFQEN